MDIDRSQGIQFDEDSHSYLMDGRRAPGITEILDHAALKSSFSDEAAMYEGRVVHKALELIAKKKRFDAEHFAGRWPHLLGLLDSGRRAIDHLKVFDAEVLCGDRIRWYCTRIDAPGYIADAIAVLNWKSGQEEAWHAIQSAAEHVAYFDDDPYDFERPTERASVYLDRDGTFDPAKQLRVYRDMNDFKVWDYACGIAEWKIGNGYARPLPKAVQRKKKEEPAILAPSTMFEATTEKASEPQGLFG